MIGFVNGDAKRLPLQNDSIQTIITSPPYWNLREYDISSWKGGDPNCSHKGTHQASGKSTLRNDGRKKIGANHYERSVYIPFGKTCKKCGATRQDEQLGLEEIPDCLAWARRESPCNDCFVCQMRIVAKELWRVLKKDGTFWLNLGDTYAANRNYQAIETKWQSHEFYQGSRVPLGAKAKDLLGIPWRVALALQGDGWWLRNEIIWQKPNAKPQRVTDRCVRDHEHLFMFTKASQYYYDFQAIEEIAKSQDGMRRKRTVWRINTVPYKGSHFATFPPKLVEPCILAGSRKGDTILDPFAGSGTTGIVARQLKRHAVLFDLSHNYLQLAQKRLEMKKIKEWKEGRSRSHESDSLDDLPLFR